MVPTVWSRELLVYLIYEVHQFLENTVSPPKTNFFKGLQMQDWLLDVMHSYLIWQLFYYRIQLPITLEIKDLVRLFLRILMVVFSD